MADVLSAPECPVGDRSCGRDPAQVALSVAAFVRGATTAGMRTCAKHFPGHGATDKDSHVAAPRVERTRAQLDACDLIPFRAAIQAGVPAVMPAHITFPALDPDAPASVSPAIIGGLLRGELGFAGVVVSDDLEMAGIAWSRPLETSAILALQAGSDLLIVSRMLLKERCIPGLLADLRLAIQEQTVAAEAVTAALGRVRRFKKGLQWQADADAACTVLRHPDHLALLAEVQHRVNS